MAKGIITWKSGSELCDRAVRPRSQCHSRQHGSRSYTCERSQPGGPLQEEEKITLFWSGVGLRKMLCLYSLYPIIAAYQEYSGLRRVPTKPVITLHLCLSVKILDIRSVTPSHSELNKVNCTEPADPSCHPLHLKPTAPLTTVGWNRNLILFRIF